MKICVLAYTSTLHAVRIWFRKWLIGIILHGWRYWLLVWVAYCVKLRQISYKCYQSFSINKSCENYPISGYAKD